MANASGVDFFGPWANEGVDIAAYSFGGFASSGAGRYLNLSDSEASNLHSHGLSIWTISENTSGRGPQGALGYTPRSGGYFTYSQGVFDANYAYSASGFPGVNSTTYGAWPSTRPVYFTVDFDAGPANINAIVNYFRGVADTIGVGRTGAYGSGYVINNLAAAGVLGFGWQTMSTGWRQNSTRTPYTVLWQKFVSGSNITGHDIDDNLMYAQDWGQWPAPSVSAPSGGSTNPVVTRGGTNNASLGVSVTSDQTSTHSLITPYESQDQVIYSSTTTTTLTNGTHTGFYSLSTNIAQYAYPVGIFSTDAGVTWNDLGFGSGGLSALSTAVLPGVQVVPNVGSDGTVTFDGINSTGSTANLIISIALLATSFPSLLNESPDNISQDKSYTNIYQTENFFQTPYSTYRRIALDSITATSSTTISHEQTDIPVVMAWTFKGGKITVSPAEWASNSTGIGDFSARVDSTNLKIDFGAPNTECFYRLYKDNT